MKAATAPSQPAKNDPTPHPAFLKQPLPTRRPDQDTTPLLPQQGSSQQPQGVLPRPEQAPAAESWRETAPQAGEKLHTETASKLQHLLSGGPGVHSPSPSPTPTHQQDSRPSPHPTSSPKHSASHTTLSGEDTEVEEVSCGSHAAAAAQGLSPRAAGTSPEAEAQGRSQGPTRGEGPSGGYPAASSASPAAESRDSASPSASPRDGREGDRKRKSLDSRGSKDSSRSAFLKERGAHWVLASLHDLHGVFCVKLNISSMHSCAG